MGGCGGDSGIPSLLSALTSTAANLKKSWLCLQGRTVRHFAPASLKDCTKSRMTVEKREEVVGPKEGAGSTICVFNPGYYSNESFLWRNVTCGKGNIHLKTLSASCLAIQAHTHQQCITLLPCRDLLVPPTICMSQQQFLFGVHGTVTGALPWLMRFGGCKEERPTLSQSPSRSILIRSQSLVDTITAGNACQPHFRVHTGSVEQHSSSAINRSMAVIVEVIITVGLGCLVDSRKPRRNYHEWMNVLHTVLSRRYGGG